MSDFREGGALGVCLGISVAGVIGDVPLWLTFLNGTVLVYLFLRSPRRKTEPAEGTS